MSDQSKWYVLRVISNKERKLKQYIELELSRSGWEDVVHQVLVPTEKVYKIKKGKKVIQEKNFFPGYILIEADEKRFTSNMVQAIRSINGVMHFLGGPTPQALRKSEVNRILGKVDEMAEMASGVAEPFIIGEDVKITDGPFNDFNGTIEEIMEDKKKLKVIVKIFGRNTPVEVNFMQVEKIV